MLNKKKEDKLITSKSSKISKWSQLLLFLIVRNLLRTTEKYISQTDGFATFTGPVMKGNVLYGI